MSGAASVLRHPIFSHSLSRAFLVSELARARTDIKANTPNIWLPLGWVNHRLCLVKAQQVSLDMGINTYHLEKTDLDQTR